MEGLTESVVTSKGQTTLPKKVRDALGLQPGDKLRYAVLKNGGVWFGKVQPIENLKGALHYDGPPKTLEQMKLGIIEGATEWFTGRGAAEEEEARRAAGHAVAEEATRK